MNNTYSKTIERLDIEQPGNDDLTTFRERLAGTALDATLYPYTLRKPKVMGYKMIFCLLGVCLLTLGLHVYQQTPNWIIDFHMGYAWIVQLLVGSFGTLLGLLSLGIGARLKTELETLMHIRSDALRKLSRLYRLYRSEALQQAYHEARHHLQEQCEQSRVLVEQIARAPFIQPEEQEALFNKALAELQQRTNIIVATCAVTGHQV